MLLKVVLALVTVAVCAAQDDLIAVNFNCASMVPSSKTLEDVEAGENIKINYTPLNYLPGETVTVTIARTDGLEFHAFMVQARKPMDTLPQGTWLQQGKVRINSCTTAQQADTILVEARKAGSLPEGITEIDLQWVAPKQAGVASKVEFSVTLVTENREAEVQQFWMANSPELNETQRAPANPHEAGEGQTAAPSMHNPQSETGGETSRHEISDDTSEEIPQDEGEQPTGEDPNGAERAAEAAREESLARDMAHDGGSEAKKQQEMQEKKELELELELQQSEGAWTAAEARENAQHEREMHEEMMLHERVMEAEMKEREERMRLEILDKENYEQERALEEERRRLEELERERERLEEERRREKEAKEIEDIDDNQDRNNKDGNKTAGASSIAGAFAATLLSLIAAAML